FAILVLSITISLFLHFYKFSQVPPCINADEVAFSYNAFSILKTGRDEYGAVMPLRFKSFEDYKLPLYTYLSVPIIAVFGLNDFSTRLLNVIIGVAFVPLLYFLAKELFRNEKVALLSSLLASLTPGIYILTRHAHEGVLSAFFSLLTLLFFVKFLRTNSLNLFILANLSLLAAAYSYQNGRVYLFFILLYEFVILWKKNIKEFFKTRLFHFVLLCLIGFIAIYPDIRYSLNRVQNLAFFKSSGFRLRLTEYLAEHPNRLLHNKLTESIREISNRYILQVSPEFLVVSGDSNWRFGFANLGLLTPLEYILFFVGLYFLFKNKERFRYLLLFVLFISPLNNALTWQDASLIRTYIILFPFLLIIAYGIYHLYSTSKEGKFRRELLVFFILVFAFFRFNAWDLYFNHYAKRAMTIRAWQCGYKELVDYVKQNYNRFDRFYITDRHGQPYIFFLYFLRYDPSKYQKQAKISAPDQYGFGQIEEFDKFYFKFKFDSNLKKSVFIGYPEGFNNASSEVLGKIKKITLGGEEIFWIYEND
ncbi:glycosyltransferase family 39 protein, partial [Candidatus Roizmanbacteria bacterium]|nr:glycosyltransferase family 39 protein [Candidatus Roizmanbacteria bacterium]